MRPGDDASHDNVTDFFLGEITSRLGNTNYGIKQDLLDNPSWFETFDDILWEPGKYWDILSEGTVVAGSPLAKWGQGKWWKNLKELSNKFDEEVVNLALVEEYGLSNVVQQVTLDVTNNAGITKRIRIDNLVFDEITGEYLLVESKFTTLTKNWNLDWFQSCTDNQKLVFEWIRNGNIKEIIVRANKNTKIQELSEKFNIDPGSLLNHNSVGLEVYGSATNYNTIGQIVKLK